MDERHKCHTEQEKSTRTTEKTEYTLSFHLRKVQKRQNGSLALTVSGGCLPGGCGASGTEVACYFLIGCWLCKYAYLKTHLGLYFRNAWKHRLEWPKSRTLTAPSAGEHGEKQELPFIAGGNTKQCSHCGAARWFFNGTKHTLTDNPAITLPGIYPKSEHLCPHKNLHTGIYSSFFIIAKAWKQPSCPSVNDG